MLRNVLFSSLKTSVFGRTQTTCVNAVFNKRSFCARPEIGQAEKLTDIGTRRIMTSDHDMFRQTVRKFFQDEIAPHQDKWEKQGYVDRWAWERAGETGILGVDVPEEKGGLGGDVMSAHVVLEEQVYANYPGPSYPIHDVNLHYVLNYGSKEQLDRYIPGLISGKLISAIGMTEPSAGSDLQGIKTFAKKDGDDWILNGSKVFITNGYMCDVAIIVAVTDPNAKKIAHGISLFLVDAGMPGFQKGRILQKIGQKAVDTAELFFEDVRIPQCNLLGEVNKGFYYLMDQLPRERLIVASLANGHAEFMFEETRNYVRERKAFGKTLSNLQTIQHKLAEMKTEICIGRAFIDQCIELYAEGRLDSSTASMAKYWCSDLENKVAAQCLQLHGGWGYMWEYPIARAFADARVQTIYAGSNEIMKELIARQIVTGN
ncbi:long-chain specific acyl-CoA dehydrogenase, mitochondrial-like [Anneissia japonica]|uniref:long-chain specific acyl-CoA dehydrogenase, mitochondrial-like n=1 Tax=Anneissia japonica TaxID=1529436 RepID=UPI0014258B1E|nr:long-chain specific acyl-CoA dehydrogenase, mitochondrial-like [Anneissia japonica]